MHVGSEMTLAQHLATALIRMHQIRCVCPDPLEDRIDTALIAVGGNCGFLWRMPALVLPSNNQAAGCTESFCATTSTENLTFSSITTFAPYVICTNLFHYPVAPAGSHEATVELTIAGEKTSLPIMWPKQDTSLLWVGIPICLAHGDWR